MLGSRIFCPNQSVSILNSIQTRLKQSTTTQATQPKRTWDGEPLFDRCLRPWEDFVERDCLIDQANRFRFRRIDLEPESQHFLRLAVADRVDKRITEPRWRDDPELRLVQANQRLPGCHHTVVAAHRKQTATCWAVAFNRSNSRKARRVQAQPEILERCPELGEVCWLYNI